MWKFKIQKAPHLPSSYSLLTTGGVGAALRFRPLTFCDLCAEYDCIQVMFSCLNSSLHIPCMLNLTFADSYTPVPCSLTCANARMIRFPHVSLQDELWPGSRPALTDDKCRSTGEILPLLWKNIPGPKTSACPAPKLLNAS